MSEILIITVSVLPPKYPAATPSDVPTAKDVGILGAAAGTIGTIQATEAIKYITGVGELLTGTLLTYDALTMTFRKVPFPQNPDCAVCGDHPTITAL